MTLKAVLWSEMEFSVQLSILTLYSLGAHCLRGQGRMGIHICPLVVLWLVNLLSRL